MKLRIVIIAALALVSSRAFAAPAPDAPPSSATTDDDVLFTDDAALEPVESETSRAKLEPHRKKHRAPSRKLRKYAIASTAFVGRSGGGSLYVALNKYLAIRVNAVAYKYQTNPAAAIAVALLAHEAYEEEDYRNGRYLDGGASVIWFPRQLLDGPMLELGTMVRYQDSFHIDWRDNVTSRESVTLAGRALVGWTWTIGRQYFVSMALGASRGHAVGRGITQDRHLDNDAPEVTYGIDGWETRFECYTRIGFTFGETI